MPDTLTQLIDKVDTFELVRDQITVLLAQEVANQQALATAEGKDPALWDMRVYRERFNPWERYLNIDNPPSVFAPIINVQYDTSTFPMGHGSTVDRQKSDTVYNIDVYGFGSPGDDPDDPNGHDPGDREAAFACQRGLRLVRNILMAGQNTYLQLPRGVVWRRWVDAVTMFQPQIDSRPTVKVVAARLAFRVEFNEEAEQVAGEALELISIDVEAMKDGKVIAEVDIDFTNP